jgi:hypothetical protein
MISGRGHAIADQQVPSRMRKGDSMDALTYQELA